MGYDGLVRDVVRRGAVLAVQTNNATFGCTPQPDQQLVMSQVRAVEHGRTVLSPPPVGSVPSSPPTGASRAGRAVHPRRVEADVPLHAALTPATRLGAAPEVLLAMVGLIGIAAGPGSDGRRRGGDALGRDRHRRGVPGQDEAPTGTRRPVSRSRSGRPGPGHHPDVQRAQNLERSSAGCAPPYPTRDVLVADDNSPDGTGKLADELAAADPRCTCCTVPASRASARHIWPASPGRMQRGYDVVVEMDADGSHPPEQLPRLLDRLRDADLVLGSRWVPGARW